MTPKLRTPISNYFVDNCSLPKELPQQTKTHKQLRRICITQK